MTFVPPICTPDEAGICTKCHRSVPAGKRLNCVSHFVAQMGPPPDAPLTGKKPCCGQGMPKVGPPPKIKPVGRKQ